MATCFTFAGNAGNGSTPTIFASWATEVTSHRGVALFVQTYAPALAATGSYTAFQVAVGTSTPSGPMD